MVAVKTYTTVKKNGMIQVKNLPFDEGQKLELILMPDEPQLTSNNFITGSELAKSEIVGLWKHRDIKDSTLYARKLRAKASRRSHTR
ncbi:MAG: hypothetical protein HYZ34_07105 [Ignavibacteriae bacterium]|nr:hypothetical protein [Ignavibacteriota bacterium]